MQGDYSRFRASYAHEELAEHFLLTPAEHQLMAQCRGEMNRQGVAVLLTSLRYLGYFPPTLHEVPTDVTTFIAHQLGLLWEPRLPYPADEHTRRYHLALIRQVTGWRAPTAQDKTTLEQWLRCEGARDASPEEELLECAYDHLRGLQIDLPAEHELRRLVRGALHGFFDDLYIHMTARLSDDVRRTLDHLLVVGPDASQSPFDQLKTEPSAPGVKPLHQEITKLQRLRALEVPVDACADVPLKLLQILKRRAHHEHAGQMRAHPNPICDALIACFIHARTMEVTDDIVRMLLEIIRRIATQKELLRDIKRVAGKVQLLFRVAEAVVEEPDGTIREVLFPRVTEATFRELVAEAKGSGPQYRIWDQYVMRQQYVHHYRQILPSVLEHLTFRSENRFQPVIQALAVIKRYLGTKYQYFPEEVPIEGVVLPRWQDTVLEAHPDGTVRVNRRYYELCVLQQLERALKCKEIWVEGSYTVRNPRQDMPADWHDEAQRTAYYRLLPQPLEVTSFLHPLRERLRQALPQFNRDLQRNPHVHLSAPAAHEERRLFAVARLTAQPAPQSLARIKDLIGQCYGLLDLLDIVVEADRLTGFTRFFTHSGTKEVRSRETLRPLLLLDLFAEGTNTGVKRMAKANHQYSYDELLYVRKHDLSVEVLRHANAAVLNTILARRNPQLWGDGHACASDGRRFESWSQNLMTEWHSRYRGYGVLVYWYVETNAVCIYSQLRNFSFSEVAAMIEGLIRHDTEMRVEKNFVDSHGQSEVAFAFCLMPRLKRLKPEAHRHGVAVHTDLAADLPLVRADRVQLQQVLLNLVLNGLDAMQAVTDRPCVSRIRAQPHAAGHVLVAVQDAGIGLDPQSVARRFEPFYTTKPEGMGLGLAISRSIIEQHGGRLWVTPNDGPGATVQFTLPAADGQQQE